MNDHVILGRAEIAFRLGRSERTVSRWIARGILHAEHDSPFSNGLLKVRASDLERLQSKPHKSEAA